MKESVLSVKDKVILVTGAFGLVGREICQSFLDHQAIVILAGHNKNEVDKIRHELAESFPSDQFIVCDLDILYSESINKCIEKVLLKYGKIDVLINNAAIDAKFNDKHQNNFSARFEEYSIDLLKQSIEVNIVGTVQMTQAACRQMLEQKHGNIINVASIYSLVAPHQELYNNDQNNQKFKPIDYLITKSYIPNFTRYIATLYAKQNIRCNAIAPGGIYNNQDENFLQNYSKFCPTGRMIDKSELDGPFIFLASDASSSVTGTTLVVDGGWTAW